MLEALASHKKLFQLLNPAEVNALQLHWSVRKLVLKQIGFLRNWNSAGTVALKRSKRRKTYSARL